MPTSAVTANAWEWIWAPYDEATYAAVLAQIQPHHTVLDIGAGDLRLAQRMARRARFVYALERQPRLVAPALADLPANCEVLIGDARTYPFPEDTAVAVLLMRHCTHLRLYWDKLVAVGCRQLITNARWGMAVEVIDLMEPRRPFRQAQMGWYACRCGNHGFITGPAEQLTPALLETIQEVDNCPQCSGR